MGPNDLDHFGGHREHHFVLPHDCLKIDRIVYPHRIPYHLEQKFIVADTRHIRLRYVRDEQDPNNFDALFLDCLSHLIGAQIAYGVSGAESKGQALKQEFEMMLKDAKRIDSQENHNLPFINADDLYYARFTRGSVDTY